MKRTIVIAALFYAILTPNCVIAQFGLTHSKGYLKELGAITFNDHADRFQYDNIIHNRFETTWRLSNKLSLQADLRTRLISGYSVRNVPGYDSYLEQDAGYFDLNRNLISNRTHVLNVQSDRLHLSYINNSLEVHIGRQRLNWAKTMVWSPNDLFNNYAYLDFDYEERPGTDAIHIQYNWSFASSIELGLQPGKSYDELVLAAMLRTNINTYDVQFIAGKYRKDLVLGAGWMGYVGNAGFRGEASLFIPETIDNPFVNVVLGSDYMFSNGLMTTFEVLYNGGNQRQSDNLAQLFEPPTSRDLFVSEYAYFLNLSKMVSPLISMSGGLLGAIDEPLHIFIPQVTYSISNSVDLLVLMQIATGRLILDRTEMTNSLFIRLKWSF